MIIKNLLTVLLIYSISTIADFRQDCWQKTHYIWNFGIASGCNVGLIKSPIHYFSEEYNFDKNSYKSIKRGDIVWIRCRFAQLFYDTVLPYTQEPFVLVINDGDESFPSDCGAEFPVEDFINHKNIVHIFAQNCDYKGKSAKISHLPIGMDFHTIGYKSESGGWGEKGTPLEQEAILLRLLTTLKPTFLRKPKAFVDFYLSDSMHADHQRYLQFGEDRKTIFNRLLPTGLIDHEGWMKRSALWQKKGEYAFSISPHGNGLDCHRTWEDLILGCIVIVKTSPLDPLYEGLPVVIVKDWSEITKENMELWLATYGDAFTNQDYRIKLTNDYWLNKIKAYTLSVAE